MSTRCARLASLVLLVHVEHEHVTCICATSGLCPDLPSFAHAKRVTLEVIRVTLSTLSVDVRALVEQQLHDLFVASNGCSL